MKTKSTKTTEVKAQPVEGPSERPWRSDIANAGNITTTSYSTNPGVTITINSHLADNVIEDLKYAIDKVLDQHKL